MISNSLINDSRRNNSIINKIDIISKSLINKIPIISNSLIKKIVLIGLKISAQLVVDLGPITLRVQQFGICAVVAEPALDMHLLQIEFRGLVGFFL